jgi:hypothetical protein
MNGTVVGEADCRPIPAREDDPVADWWLDPRNPTSLGSVNFSPRVLSKT